MKEQEQQEQQEQQQQQQPTDDQQHGECCDDCKQKCKRNFWTSVLNAIVKVTTIVLAAFGITSFSGE